MAEDTRTARRFLLFALREVAEDPAAFPHRLARAARILAQLDPATLPKSELATFQHVQEALGDVAGLGAERGAAVAKEIGRLAEVLVERY
jgi:hypothetical protein